MLENRQIPHKRGTFGHYLANSSVLPNNAEQWKAVQILWVYRTNCYIATA